jgi:hypothetical protein
MHRQHEEHDMAQQKVIRIEKKNSAKKVKVKRDREQPIDRRSFSGRKVWPW